jgi:hypothetical protein
VGEDNEEEEEDDLTCRANCTRSDKQGQADRQEKEQAPKAWNTDSPRFERICPPKLET